MKHAAFSLLAITLLAATAHAADDSAANAYFDGLDALSAGRYADADKALTQAVTLDAENAAYYQARGVARTLGENFAAAITDFEKAGRLAPAKDWETSAWLATASKMDGHPEVTFTPGSAPRADTEYAIALSDLGQNYWQSRYQGSYYDKSLRQAVTTKAPYKGDFPKVTAFYVQRHLGVAGASAKTLLARIQSSMSAGKYLEALQALQPVLTANSGDPDLLAAKAQILLALEDLEGARSQYTDLLTRRISASAYLGRAKAAAKMGDPYRAARDLAQAAQLDPAATTAAQKEIAPLLSVAPANPQTLWDKLETQCQAAPPVPAAQFNETAAALVRAMGALRIRYDERYQDRLAKLEADLRAGPNDPARMIALARFLRDESGVLGERVGPRAEPRPYRAQSPADLQHDLDRADQLVETALRDHPDNLAALTLKAHFKIQAKQYDEAQAIVTKALAIQGNDPDLLEVLASLLQIQAARHIYAAGNLRELKTWWETSFMESPPVTYKFTRFPSQAELAEAAAEERRAAALCKLAEERLAQAVEGAGPTPLGWYYRATLLRVRGDSAGAKEAMTKAVTMQPDFQQAWYQLASLYTDLRDADGAIAARARAYNLAQTTAVAELNALWFKIPHGQLKAGRETVAAGVKIDPADPRLPGYLAVIDEATEKPADALAHYRMAQALSDANLALHGTHFSSFPPGRAFAPTVPLAAEDAAFPAAIRLRLAALLLDQNKCADATAAFADISAALAAFPATDSKRPPADALLPNPEPREATVPLAESIGFLQIRAAAGSAYARWAAAQRTPQDADLAAKTYRRLLIGYAMTTESLDALKAIADLGLAELYVQSGQFPQASAALASTPAVPQDFWQEMRRTEAAVRGGQGTP